eukprot:CAMPEP_0202870668 /NCGR_PEP_ID=MMETSP1391-20130828/16407_1 /ASSEMBLY_ACC=CAM_ASM_000867 /TAXON_ID=1034604 /ORGANISM="Chlamydomonas leiostraca, Strain SAG 11-49" /LENGTH=96 /DNA_ID=CAMNT_0049551289 /DNA_START=119 /DNA_END=405 /DNA_ORIENTATION=+
MRNILAIVMEHMMLTFESGCSSASYQQHLYPEGCVPCRRGGGLGCLAGLGDGGGGGGGFLISGFGGDVGLNGGKGLGGDGGNCFTGGDGSLGGGAG